MKITQIKWKTWIRQEATAQTSTFKCDLDLEPKWLTYTYMYAFHIVSKSFQPSFMKNPFKKWEVWNRHKTHFQTFDPQEWLDLEPNG